MEIANLKSRERRADPADVARLTRLLQVANYQHLHADWQPPDSWLGTPGFRLVETSKGHGLGAGQVLACLAIGADPPPAAWVRVAALLDGSGAVPFLTSMLEPCLDAMTDQGVTEIGWLPAQGWPQSWVEALGFEQVNEVVMLVKADLITSMPNARETADLRLRNVTSRDLPHLAAIERAAFAPLWRHSANSLALGGRQALCFRVAEKGSELVGFQYSTHAESADGAHLVRLTVSPEAQRSGVGSCLLRDALAFFRTRGITHVTLNTQADNVASHRLYTRFGFERVAQSWPVWLRILD